MFAKDWGGDGPARGPTSGDGPQAISRDLLATCEESTRRAERLVQLLDPVEPGMEMSERSESLGWAIRALEQTAGSETAS